jgi:hypothetical protein
VRCPKCGLARGMDDRVCRRCKYLFDEDRYLALMPPRATDRSLPERLLGRRFRVRLAGWTGDPWVPVVASLVPGLGHLVLGRVRTGLVFMALVGALIILSIRSFSGLGGQILFGLGVSAHACCILDMTPWARSPQAWPRAVAMAVILAVLLAAYWPLLTFLANLLVPARRVERDGYFGPPANSLATGRLVAMALLFMASLWVSTRAGRWWASRRSGGSRG